MKRKIYQIMAVLFMLSIMTIALALAAGAYTTELSYDLMTNPLPYSIISYTDFDVETASFGRLPVNTEGTATFYVDSGFGSTSFTDVLADLDGNLVSIDTAFTMPYGSTEIYLDTGYIYATIQNEQALADYLDNVHIGITSELTGQYRVAVQAVVTDVRSLDGDIVLEDAGIPISPILLSYNDTFSLGDVYAATMDAFNPSGDYYAFAYRFRFIPVDGSYLHEDGFFVVNGVGFDTPVLSSREWIDGVNTYAQAAGYTDGYNKGASDAIFEGSLSGFFSNTLVGFFDTNILGSVSIGDIFLVVIGLALVIIFLRMFAGG